MESTSKNCERFAYLFYLLTCKIQTKVWETVQIGEKILLAFAAHLMVTIIARRRQRQSLPSFVAVADVLPPSHHFRIFRRRFITSDNQTNTHTTDVVDMGDARDKIVGTRGTSRNTQETRGKRKRERNAPRDERQQLHPSCWCHDRCFLLCGWTGLTIIIAAS